MKNAWTYIVLNCVLAVLSVLSAVAWPQIVGPQVAGYVVAALAAANAIAHALAGPGPASS